MFLNLIKKSWLPAILFFLSAYCAHANFEITELMYDLDGTDTNREWVEVSNTGAEPADLSKWFLFSDNTKHALVPQGASEIGAGAYAVIVQDVVKFKQDWPNYGGLIFDSSWTGFNNESETISLKDPDLNIISPVTFASGQGGAGDGNSLQNTGGAWVGASPTLGAASQASSGNSSSNSGSVTAGGSSSSSGSTTTSSKKESEVPRITTDIISKNIVFAGLSFSVNAHTLGLSKEPLSTGRFVWNFGDGTTKDFRDHKEFSHEYDYPGEYVMTLSYFKNFYVHDIPDATDRLIIKVVPADMYISSVGTDLEPYVELENKSDFEIPLSQWMLKGTTRYFVIPDGTMLLSKRKIRFSPHATSFDAIDISSVILQNPNQKAIASYKKEEPVVESAKPPLPVRSVKGAAVTNVVPQKSSSVNAEIIDLNNLAASAQSASISSSLSSKQMAWAGLGGVMILGIVSTLFLRRKPKSKDSEEGEISASDMTIVE